MARPAFLALSAIPWSTISGASSTHPWLLARRTAASRKGSARRSSSAPFTTVTGYCLPRADDLQFFDAAAVELPCLNNPLGVKGCGEAGAIAAPAAAINAILDALVELGIDHIDMPATPEGVWLLMLVG